MMAGTTVTRRRTLIQRGLALLAGGAAIAGGTRLAVAASPPASVLTLYARRRPAASYGEGRLSSSGDLLDGPDGNRVGSFHANCFCQPVAFGALPIAASNLEFHVLQLPDGTIFGMGSGVDDAVADSPLAITGGTGRYAGRTGTYIQRAIAGPSAGDDVRQLTITFAG